MVFMVQEVHHASKDRWLACVEGCSLAPARIEGKFPPGILSAWCAASIDVHSVFGKIADNGYIDKKSPSRVRLKQPLLKNNVGQPPHCWVGRCIIAVAHTRYLVCSMSRYILLDQMRIHPTHIYTHILLKAHIIFSGIDNVEPISLISLLDDFVPLHHLLSRHHSHNVAHLLLAQVLEQKYVLHRAHTWRIPGIQHIHYAHKTRKTLCTYSTNNMHSRYTAHIHIWRAYSAYTHKRIWKKEWVKTRKVVSIRPGYLTK